jgi:uncharacterized delta-60 repeat protein
MRLTRWRQFLAAGAIALAGARVSASGIDPNFAPNLGGPSSARAMTVAGDGSFYLVGPFDSIGATSLTGVARLMPNGTVDPNFMPPLVAFQTTPYADRVVTMSDGRVLVTGNFGGFGSAATVYAVILNADGTVAQTFNAVRSDSAVIHYFPLASGKLLASDERVAFSQPQVYGLARLLSDGSIDNSFSSAEQYVNQIVEEPGGAIVLAEGAPSYPNSSINTVKRILANGAPDPSFAQSTYSGPVNVLVRQTDGKVLVGGDFPRGIRRLNTDGTEDMGFTSALGSSGAGDASGGVRTILIESDGHILLGGSFFMNTPVIANGMVRLASTGTPITGGYTISGAINSIVQTAAVITIVGDFQNFLGSRRVGAARMSTSGALDSNYHPILASKPAARLQCFAQQPDERLIVAGSFQQVDGMARDSFARLMPDGTLDAGYHIPAGISGNVQQVVALPDGRSLIVGGFATVDGLPRPYLARLLADGNVDATFDAAVGASGITRVWVNADGSIFAGTTGATFRGISRVGLALLTPNGGLDASFNPGSLFVSGIPNTMVWGAKYSADHTRVMAFGFFSIPVPGGFCSNVVALHLNGTIDSTFRASLFSWPAYDVLPDSAGNTYVVGQFESNDVAAGYQRCFVRLRTDGTPDPALATGSGFSGVVNHILPQPNGQLLLCGDFLTSNSNLGVSLARFNSDGSQDNSLPFVSAFGTNFRDVALRADVSIIATTARDNTLLRIVPDTASPVILTDPKSQRRLPGSSIQLDVSVAGAPNLQFQWYRNNQPVPNGQSASLLISNFSGTSAGDYYVVVSNSLGSAPSGVATLALNSAPQLSNIPDYLFPSPPASLTVPFTLTDAESAPNQLKLTFSYIGTHAFLSGIDPLLQNFGDGQYALTIWPLTVSPPGSYGYMDLTLQAADPDDGTATQTFRVFVRDPHYSEWAAQYFTPTELANSAIGGSTADPNRNGVPNLLEYARGANPKAVDHSRDPQLALTGPPGNQALTLTYYDTIRHNEVVQVVEVSDDLLSWDTSGNQWVMISAEPDLDGRTQRVTLQLASPVLTGTPHKFFRFRATRVGPP